MSQISVSEIKKYINEVVKEIVGAPDEENAFIEALRKGLGCITEKYTTMEYSFNLSMEYFIGRAPSNCYDTLKSILEADIEEADDYSDTNLDVAFAAYYALSLIYKKQNDIESLAQLVSDKYDALDRYPLRYEVKARYFKRIKNYEEALENDEHAINILESRDMVNPAVGISFASTVCNCLEISYDINPNQIDLAHKNIDDAIAFNPQYPKYYFLKAKLIFYSMTRKETEKELQAKEQEILQNLKKAQTAHFDMHQGTGNFRVTEEKEYSEFRKRVKDTIDRRRHTIFPKDAETLNELKKYILAAENRDICESNSKLPPLPQLKKGDKYFFVCYSSRDFKSVFCDLIELYKNKIPFKYDEDLTDGTEWDEQIERYVSDPDCVGVVFYLSRNNLYTDAITRENSITREIDIVTKYQKKHFCINLEGSLHPSKILIQFILETCSLNPEKYTISGDTMRKYLSFFKDKEVFTSKPNQASNDSISHFKTYIKNIRENFPSIIIEE